MDFQIMSTKFSLNIRMLLSFLATSINGIYKISVILNLLLGIRSIKQAIKDISLIYYQSSYPSIFLYTFQILKILVQLM